MLASSRRNYFSMGGRLMVSELVSPNMPTYFMSLYEIPKVLKKKLEELQRNFIRNGKSDKRRLHLVNWEEVKKP